MATIVIGRRLSAAPASTVRVEQVVSQWPAGVSRYAWPGGHQVSERVAVEVHFRPGSRTPRVGDELDIWIDVATPYAMAIVDR